MANFRQYADQYIGGIKMIEVIGVRFKKAGKIYYFGPNGIEIKKG